MASEPSPDDSIRSMVVTSVVSVSEAVAINLSPSMRRWKHSRTGNVFLALMTRLMACKWLCKVELDTMKFISNGFLGFFAYKNSKKIMDGIQTNHFFTVG